MPGVDAQIHERVEEGRLVPAHREPTRRDEDLRVRYQALFALNCRNLAIPECRPELEALLTDESETIREDARKVLDRLDK